VPHAPLISFSSIWSPEQYLVKRRIYEAPLLQLPATFSLLVPHFIVVTLFSDTLDLCSSLSVRHQVSHPYRTKDYECKTVSASARYFHPMKHILGTADLMTLIRHMTSIRYTNISASVGAVQRPQFEKQCEICKTISTTPRPNLWFHNNLVALTSSWSLSWSRNFRRLWTPDPEDSLSCSKNLII
jgi:hypothetical protein